MKFRVTLISQASRTRSQHHDVTLTVDVTATVKEVASGLVRAGAGHPDLLPIAVHRQAPLTLRVTHPNQLPLILYSGARIVAAGLQSGMLVEPVLELPLGDGRRAQTPTATLTVLDGSQEGVSFLAVTGTNTIGRDRNNRIELHDRSVSRRHAILHSRDGTLEVEDLGSANGTSLISPDGTRAHYHARTMQITERCIVELGTIRVRIDPGPPPAARDPERQSTVPHLPAPHVDPVFTPAPIELPAPPHPAEPTRFPSIAMVAPLLMGIVLYAATQSFLSIIFIALSPLIMVGTWVDNRISKGKIARVKRREFEAGLEQAQHHLDENRHAERTARNQESPHPQELLRLPQQRSLGLWRRRPEHRAFLEVRLGAATLPSRKEISLPARGNVPAGDWEKLTDLMDRHGDLPEVPMLERFDRCGALAVAGPALWADAVTRALLVQLFALHSPADVVFTAFADEEQASQEWRWLKWAPHVDSPYSPVAAPHLVADRHSSYALLAALEGLIRRRQHTVSTRTVRSRLEGMASTAEERCAPADRHPSSPAVIVLVLSGSLVDRTRLVGLAEDGADVGVYVLWVAPELSEVPAACRTVIEVTQDCWHAHFVRQGVVTPLTRLDAIEAPLAEIFGRALAPMVDAGARVLDESDLPRSVALSEIMPTDVLGLTEAILNNWRRTDSLSSTWTRGAEREPGQLTAVIGQGSAGAVRLDLRTHGPHALVGGTTGSGKSEFLQTWILSLAAHYSPDRVTFLLVDYKGGAAFADCVDLPHTVGLVTDLTAHLVRRALTSLRAELRYREELLAEKGAKDLAALERRSDPDAPPALIILIDEFAALVNEIPEFVDGVIDVAQRGRSLGLHLVLATQRPAGVIKDNLRANTNLRVGLRMADPVDSDDVLGVADAAWFAPDTPGRAAVKVGAGALTHFQTAYLGGRSDTEVQETVEVRALEFGEHAPWVLQPEARRTPQRSNGPRDIERLVRNIRGAARAAATAPPRKPWVDQLPEILSLSGLESAGAPTHGAQPFTVRVGLADEPHLQRHSPYPIEFNRVGNVAIVGGAGSGKTTALFTIACAAISRDPQTMIYGIDAGGGRLTALASLPNSGEIVHVDERERISRLLALLKELISERRSEGSATPPVLLLIDGFAALRERYEHTGRGVDPCADLAEVARSGRPAGVHVCFTSERPNAFPTAIASSIEEQIVLRLPAESDYERVGVPAAVLAEAPPGRALRIGTDVEIQLALPGSSADPADTDAALESLRLALCDRGVSRPLGVPAVPEVIERTALGIENGQPSFAIETAHLRPVPVPESGLLLVTGPAGSGRTTAIRSLLEAFAEGGTRQQRSLDAILLSPRASELGTMSIWREVGDTAQRREELLGALIAQFGGGSHGPGSLPLLPLIGGGSDPPASTPVSSSIEFPSPAHRGVVVVEDIGGFDGTGNERTLAALLKLLRRSDITVIVEGENATLHTVWELASPLRGARWALALQPDANDTPSIFTAPFTHSRRSDFPPGRGLLIEGGTLTGIHVGLPARRTSPE